MSRKNENDAVIIVLDVGKTVSELNIGENKTFFEKSRDCISWIIQRKLISRSKDFLALVLMGTDETDNALGGNDYPNIVCKFDFQMPSFDMLRFIETGVKTTNKSSDWVKALVVCLDMLNSHEQLNFCSEKSVIFFSDFTNPATDEINTIIKAIKVKKIGIKIIGPDCITELPSSSNNGEPAAKRFRSENGQAVEKSKERKRGEKLILDMWEKLGDLLQICTFENALKQLSSYKKKAVALRPWNAVLDIGDVGIKISAYKKTDTSTGNKFDTKCLKPSAPLDPSQPSTSTLEDDEKLPVVRDKVMHYVHQDKDTNEVAEVLVRENEIVEGYKYGSTIVPFTDADKENLQFKSGERGLSILGFSPLATFPMKYVTGDCVYVIAPRDHDENSEIALSALIQAMKKEGYVAIARKVYNNDKGLSLVVLYPIVEEIDPGDGEESYYKECLLMIELAYDEEVRSLEFGSLDEVSKTITQKQYEAVDNLIDEMDLMTADRDENGEPCEALDWTSLHEIKNQFFQYCVIQRGLYPDKPIPKELPERFKDFVTMPKSLIEKNKALGLALKNIFSIEVKEEKKPDMKGKNIIGRKSKGDEQNGVNDVFARIKSDDNGQSSSGIVKKDEPLDESLDALEPSVENDFKKLFRGSQLPNETAIENNIKYYVEDMGTSTNEVIKALQNCIIEARRKAVKSHPEDYNFWIRKIKRFCFERGGVGPKIWESIVSECLGLISDKENKLSRVNEDEAEEFVKSKITPSPAFQSPKSRREFGSIPESVDSIQRNEALDELF